MTTIYTFAQSAIEEAQNAGRYGTANLYTSAIKSFRKFTGDMPLTFKELTPGLIKKYEESLLQKGRRHNTISAYMRMLRSIKCKDSEHCGQRGQSCAENDVTPEKCLRTHCFEGC